jgi:adenylosuccinate synthase
MMMMTHLIVVGAQWGDEGKAKVVDQLAEFADMVIRSQGGSNAGHTVKFKGETFKFHHLPSGLLYEEKTCVIGPGVVLAPHFLQDELESIHAKGYSTKNLKISDRCHITFPYHISQDKAQETLRSCHNGSKIGTTGKGIGPTYMDKVGRMGVRVADLFEPEATLKTQLESILTQKELNEYFTLDEIYTLALEYKAILAPYACDTLALLQNALKAGKQLLFEGAQGTLLDVDFGTYPYVTSSNSTAGGACTGTGVGPSKIDATLGVMKAYLTRVGEGPFPTELSDTTTGERICEIGVEYGTTTGRKRRVGWFDAVIARFGVEVNGLDGIALTKLDVLDSFETIDVCTGYVHAETGQHYDRLPTSLTTLSHLKPVYETHQGWLTDTTACKTFDSLPTNCQAYVRRLEVLMDCPVWMVSIGPDREQTLMRKHPFVLEMV